MYFNKVWLILCELRSSIQQKIEGTNKATEQQTQQHQRIPVKVTLDISRSPIEIQWGSWKYLG